MDYDVIIKNGLIYDGSGQKSYNSDIAIKSDKIVKIGDLKDQTAGTIIDASNLIVSPGFINVLSWAIESLIEDGRGLSDLKQGVTLEIFGEGFSMGPLNEIMKKNLKEEQGDIKYEVNWTSLSEYLAFLEKKGISVNVASFVGATTVRINVLGYSDRAPNKEELEKMKELVEQSMKDGALGVGSALIYAPGFYAKTSELIELCKVASKYNGMYISHIRSEGSRLDEAVDELIAIARQANINAEIYHLKGVEGNLSSAITKIEKARAEGLGITADMYTYTAAATGLDAAMPPWVQEGGLDQWIKNLQNAEMREKVISEMRKPSKEWENMYYAAGPDKMLISSFKNPNLRKYNGKTIAEIAIDINKTPEETVLDLVVEDHSRVGTIYFVMTEEDIKKKIALPYMSFCSDEGTPAPEGVFLNNNHHPRAYGSFARLLGKYVRDEKVIPMEDAIRKLTSLPAQNLKILNRGLIKENYFADIVIFNPKTINDKATYEKSHQLAEGVIHVFVNGKQVIKEGNHTGVFSGRAIKRAQ